MVTRYAMEPELDTSRSRRSNARCSPDGEPLRQRLYGDDTARRSTARCARRSSRVRAASSILRENRTCSRPARGCSWSRRPSTRRTWSASSRRETGCGRLPAARRRLHRASATGAAQETDYENLRLFVRAIDRARVRHDGCVGPFRQPSRSRGRVLALVAILAIVTGPT